MFGYVNVYKDELKIKDYNTYRSYYCGLCKTIGKRHNQLSRLALNYDFTFLAVLADSLCIEPCIVAKEGCVKRLGKRPVVKDADGIGFAADMNILFAYLKLKDDLVDSHSVKALFSVVPFAFRIRKIRKNYPELSQRVNILLRRLRFLEKSKCDICDKVAHEFAGVLEAMFEYVNPSLKKMGYILGRLIYIMDACDDVREDIKKGNYNPVTEQYNITSDFTPLQREQIGNLLYNTLASLAQEYESLDIKKNKEILDNIIYLGLRARCDLIISTRDLNERKTQNERSV